MKEQKGITIVSLVVTIIILIILAGVTITAALGENGIITISKQAKENMQLAQIDEQTKLNELYMQMLAEGGTSGGIAYDEMVKLTEFKKVIAEAITNNGVETSEEDTAEKMAENIGIIKNNEEQATAKLTEFKTKIAEAITDKGVDTDANDSLETMVDNISNITSNSDISITLPLKGVYNSYLAGTCFSYTNTGYSYLKYKYSGFCGCTIKGDGTTLVSIGSTSSPNTVTKSETLDISNYSKITVEQRTVGYTDAGLTLTFTNTP